MSDQTRVRIALTSLPVRCGNVLWLQERNRYVTPTPAALRTLSRVATNDGGFAEETVVDEDADWRGLDELEQLGLIVWWDDSKGLPVRRRDVIGIACWNVLGRVALRVAPRFLLRQLVDTRSRPAPEFSPWAGLRSEQLIAAARAAAAMPLVSASCLPMALALWCSARIAGQPARLRLGGTADPFTEHAWVEVRGHRLDPAPVSFPGEVFRH